MKRFWTRYMSKGTRRSAWDRNASPYSVFEQPAGKMSPTTQPDMAWDKGHKDVSTCAGCHKSMVSLCNVNGMIFPLPPSTRCGGHDGGGGGAQLGSPTCSEPPAWATSSPRPSRASVSGFSDWSSIADRPSRAARLKPKLKKSMYGLRSKVGRLSI